jgi:ParB family chromosome partitioning protein
MSPRHRPPSPEAPVIPTAEYRVVPIDAVDTSPLNPRHRNKGRHDDALKELAASIRTHGILEPIVVRPRARVESDERPTFEVVAGNRRRRAAGLAGLPEIPVTIRDVTDQQLLELALTENVQRSDMHPLDEAEALNELQRLDPVYKDLAVLGAKVGRSATYVRDRLKLRTLDPIVLEALDADAITLRHAEVIGRLTADQHLRALEECFAKVLTVGNEHYVGRSDAIDKRKWTELGAALMGTRDLEAFVKQHAKADVTAPEVQEQLREIVLEQGGELDDADDAELTEAQVGAALEEATAKVLQLSQAGGYDFTRRKAHDAHVVHKSDWKAAKPGSCKYVRDGVIVHPAGVEQRVLSVCASKSCAKHHPKQKASSGGLYGESPASAAKRKAEQERQDREREAWKQDQPTIFAALVAAMQRRKYSVLELAKLTLSTHDLSLLKRDFGLKLSPGTAAISLLLAAAPQYTYSRAEFLKYAKALGVKESELAIAETPSKAAKAKTAKAKAA